MQNTALRALFCMLLHDWVLQSVPPTNCVRSLGCIFLHFGRLAIGPTCPGDASSHPGAVTNTLQKQDACPNCAKTMCQTRALAHQPTRLTDQTKSNQTKPNQTNQLAQQSQQTPPTHTTNPNVRNHSATLQVQATNTT